MFFQLLIRIQKNKHHIAFILSVVLSFILIYFSPSSQFSFFRHTVNSVTNYIKSPFTKLSKLTKVEIENEVLREQLLLLSLENEKLLTKGIENVELKKLLNLRQDLQLKMIPAKVINKGLSTSLIALTVDVGSDSGVSVNDAVLTHNGVIGKIYSVTKSSSIVHLINDPNFRMGVRFLPSSETGILRWKANNNCEVREVYKNSLISVGDPVITSGLSDIFPENLPVGTVVSVANSRDHFQKIVSIKIEENLNSLTYLFVIIDGASN